MTAEGKCQICGKKGRRPCPALAGWVCPACCGSHRGSKINCARDCSFFPFGIAAYDTWLKIEGEWLLKSAKYLIERLGRIEFDQIWKAVSIKTNEPDLDREASLNNAIYFGLFTRRDGQGKTLADLWESERWTGLNNDELLMMRFRRLSLVTAVEIQKKVDHQMVECLDLFEREPRPFLLFDRALAERAPRFTRLLVRLTHFPHFSRTSGLGYPIPLTLWPIWREQIQTATSNAALRQPGLTVREFLSESLARAVGLIHEISNAYRRQLYSSLDAHQCMAFYELAGSYAEVETILKAKPDFKAEEPPTEPGIDPPKGYFNWLCLGESADLARELPAAVPSGEAANDTRVLGNVRLYPDGMMVETPSLQKYEVSKKMVEKHFGGLVRFQRERIVDLAKQMMERRAAEEALHEATGSLREAPRAQVSTSSNTANTESEQGHAGGEAGPDRLPPHVERQLLHEIHEKKYAALLDDKIPALDGSTPRAAAKDPALRPKLVELMKIHLHNLERQNLESGLDLRLDSVLDELGLSELK